MKSIMLTIPETLYNSGYQEREVRLPDEKSFRGGKTKTRFLHRAVSQSDCGAMRYRHKFSTQTPTAIGVFLFLAIVIGIT